jgi:hypothetical protein
MVNGKKKKIACLKMYGETCPCCEKSSEYYNAGDSKMGKMFWRKIDYVAQGLVINSPFEFTWKPEANPVHLLSMSKQLYEKLETEIVKGDLDAMPYDMQNGYDFRIIKNKKIVPSENGGPAKEFGNYADSGFARKSTPIPESFLQNLELLDLKNFRFAKIEREVMEAMIEAALTGRSFEENKGSGGDQQSTGNPSLDKKLSEKPASVSTESVATPTPSAPSAPAASTSTAPAAKLSPQEILARLKNRTA